MASETVQRYYPRIVGLTPHGKTGPSGRWFELLVTGKDRVGGLARLTALLAQHEINLAPSGGYYLLTDDTYVWTTFVNFSRSRSPLERVVKDLRRLDFVSEVDAVEVDGAAIDKFLFPVHVSDHHRGIILSMSPLLKLEERLTEMLGSAGAVLMYEEGKAYAKASLNQLRETMHDAAPAKLFEDVADWLRTTGWGIFTFDSTNYETEGTIDVLVREPPNALANGKHESHFTDGVVAGIIEAALNKAVNLAVSKYEEASQTLNLHFRTSAK